ncbi:PREDICTED: gastric triacylglycerol lipase-like isoform X1 [Trachymyrmex cornetzi]|uniref:Lipase n=1 Tax=Trachymyrmex cornetzi TaxID=471704 RepID=A0A195DSJ6_9HYME|nr:PREDICTED: gastric triacylglycerol lipase-like isoform X1 [Trachymyrmex cornetzi]XP_018368467.1 PREDICTED: gastric triacylglycerol lipase-like isoform X1 [Trachymyrmex cornetzi]KYN15823.1 Lipase 1 [Trachymyrmex cornetzi]
MTMGMKFASFVFMLTVVLLEPKLNVHGQSISIRKMILNFIFPKDSDVVRVRKPEDIKTTMNNVTTLDFFGLVEKYGYTAEEHYVTTEDGYHLVIHRITGSPLFKGQQTGKVVFLQTGLFGTSDCWVLIGAGKDLAFLLADKGYDVWLGNARGSSYCRSHVKLSPRNKEFWQFSFHEMGTRDLPAMIDYVLDYTKQKSLHFVGISMGNTVLFVLLSMKPEYNAKIKLAVCLAPAAFYTEVSPLVQYTINMIRSIRNFQEILDFNEIYEVGSLTSTNIMMGRTLCADNTITQAVCVASVFLFSGANPSQLNTTAFPEILSNYPAGSSRQTLVHYYQNMVTKKFQAYDYGYIGNYKHYKQATPITYDVKKITAPVAIFYGGNDLLALKSTIFELYKRLPNVVLLEEQKSFTHLDFIIAIDVNTLVYSRVIELFQEFDNKA